jgi:tetratricopeptide (TPR) repeat protein
MRYLKSSAVTGCAVALSLCVSSGAAYGQTDEQRAGARSLATEGAAAFNDARYKDAVDLFTKAESLMHAPPHLLYLARAHAKLGQFVKAREAYLRVTKEQLAPNAPQAFREAQSTAQKELSAVNPKIGSLEIKVEGAEAAKDLAIKIDGTPIASVLVGVPQAVDPGEHRIEASATGFRAQPQTVRLGEGEKASTILKLEVDPNAAPATAAHPGHAAPAAAPGAPPAAAPVRDTSVSMDTTSSGSGMRIGSYVGFGVGAVGLGLGTVFLLKAGSKRSDADALCNLPNGACPASKKSEIQALDDEAKSAATLSVVGFAVGGAGIAAGVEMLLLSGKSESSAAARPAIYPWVANDSAGLAGRF